MNRRWLALATSLGIFGLDRGTKWLVETRLEAWDTKPVIPGFMNIVRSENPGVAFGIFADAVSQYRTTALVLMSMLAICVLAWLVWRIEKHDRLTAAGIALIFGGALGNVFDRVRSGRVTDFIDVYAGTWHWYIFNVADAAICVGAGLLILGMFLTERALKRSEAGA
jgi:signal peptidase II